MRLHAQPIAVNASLTIPIHVEQVNAAPTDIQLSQLSVHEKSVNGVVDGQLLVTDPDPEDAFTFTVLPGPASSFFAIDSSGSSGSNLVVASLFRFAQVQSLTITGARDGQWHCSSHVLESLVYHYRTSREWLRCEFLPTQWGMHRFGCGCGWWAVFHLQLTALSLFMAPFARTKLTFVPRGLACTMAFAPMSC